ncbi:formyltetrahydrofolate-dependent phosphoribosylglycinamide formyltransferase [Rhodothalassium salexigens DSM 2132]|uniref:Phosphoribosylglycinamide formyltransferase n=1 Tax=Rhodothalassium salexigens DSM 2132 TaxID=1188247 RepID=A0A4R2PT48_RHOSA|nr:phosphoribosylglycinamide formyltransferase [Rhodothalassium salexigens]MBB4210129.1 phosphoribosylglycinamide formyltransferase-1 [Rhodothalassium salexigens DSM 2132]MBK1638453.1 phosphoribosylglycinamide formyltransferase [Rhodothalassium salexigens DSM 2132]TCP38294.1 formyltetrahydrofolate-dependent phosphoribosylglycinamide formyltransferase [Rhodothalassium salexigens DSM 2132]
MAHLSLGILISGRGSNMAALIEACTDPAYPAQVAVVIANVADAPGLDKARAAGIETVVVDHKAYDNRDAFEAALDSALKAARVDLVCLAGFMRLLNADFVKRWRDRIVNIHPSLLPAYKGLDTHARVLEDGVRVTGCTVHFVRPEMDHGPIVIQAAVPVLPDDTVGRLAARVLEQEHRIFVEAVRLIASGRVRVSGDKVLIEGSAPETAVLVNPQIV